MFIRMLVVRHSLNFYGFSAQVPDAEPTQPMDVYPLMIDCNGFHVGSASWFHHREKFPGSSMTGILRSRFRRFLRKEEFLCRFFYSEFDASILEDQKTRREQSERDCGQFSASNMKDLKEEPAEVSTLDLENCRYSFYLRPRRDEV